jgi:oligopeptide transport system permease protein
MSDQDRKLEKGNIPGTDEESSGFGPGHSMAASPEAKEAAAVAAGSDSPAGQASLWSDAWRQLRKNPFFIVPVVLLVAFSLLALFPGFFATYGPYDCDLSRSVGPPQSGHPFGFDVQGCDYYSKVIYGTRVSLIIGLYSVFGAAVIGIVLGCIAGYYGGLWDALLARITDIWFAIPTTLGGIVVLSVLSTRGIFQVGLVLVILAWPTMMRLMRSSVLSSKEMDYVYAARALGAGDMRILTKHILPNGIAPVIVYGTISVGILIAAEATLSFLGVGLQLPAISWGLMISGAQRRILASPHLLFFPGIFLSVLVFTFILLGDALRDALDPKLR